MIFLLQFSLILLIFVCPPILVNFSDDLAVDFSKFNYFALTSLALALFLFFQDLRERRLEGTAVQDNKRPLWKAAAFTSNYFLTFGSLAVCGCLFELAGLALKTKTFENIIFPANFLQGLFCAFALASSAFYEECLYRLYLPKALKKIAALTGVDKKSEDKDKLMARPKIAAAAVFWACEAACVLLFAFAHRYQGPLALLNALLAGIILRLSFVKSKSLWPPFFAHLSYNAAALMLARLTLVP